VLVACTAPTASPEVREATIQTATETAISGVSGATIRVHESTYGALSLSTMPGARCEVEITAPVGTLSDGPARSIAGEADATGELRLTYAAPRLPSGFGQHHIRCSGSGGSVVEAAPFSVAGDPLSAAHFTVRITSVASPTAKAIEEATLVPLRDASAAKLSASLSTEWEKATRGLSRLTVVGGSADIVVNVIAARSASVHRTAADTSEDILLYVADEHGPRSVENLLAVVLHELGHIWCCRGPGATDSHWSEQVESPGLLGVDRFGLMNHPVSCLIVPSGFLSCPNRFSDRELQAMGFTQIPAPLPDSCVLQRDALLAQIRTAAEQLSALALSIEAGDLGLDPILARITEIEVQYPSRLLPPEVYEEYSGLIDRYNQQLRALGPSLDQYNSLRERHNAMAEQRNRLSC
jgi:hypothetical protein